MKKLYQKLNPEHIVVLYNRGLLSGKDDPYFYRHGYRIIRRDGKVVKVLTTESRV